MTAMIGDKSKLSETTCSSRTQRESRQVLTRKCATPCCLRLTKLDLLLRVSRLAICHRQLDGASWCPTEVVKLKTTSSVTSFAASELERSKVEHHVDQTDLPNTTRSLELKRNLEARQFSPVKLSEIHLTS